jgi:hypothetical protein
MPPLKRYPEQIHAYVVKGTYARIAALAVPPASAADFVRQAIEEKLRRAERNGKL